MSEAEKNNPAVTHAQAGGDRGGLVEAVAADRFGAFQGGLLTGARRRGRWCSREVPSPAGGGSRSGRTGGRWRCTSAQVSSMRLESPRTATSMDSSRARSERGWNRLSLIAHGSTA